MSKPHGSIQRATWAHQFVSRPPSLGVLLQGPRVHWVTCRLKERSWWLNYEAGSFGRSDQMSDRVQRVIYKEEKHNTDTYRIHDDHLTFNKHWRVEHTRQDIMSHWNYIPLKKKTLHISKVPALLLYSKMAFLQTTVPERNIQMFLILSSFLSTLSITSKWIRTDAVQLWIKKHHKSVMKVVHMACALNYKSSEAIWYICMRNRMKPKWLFS